MPSHTPPASGNVSTTWVPDGYAVVIGPDNRHFLVPEFMVPALQQTFDGQEIKLALGVFEAAGSVRNPFSISFMSGLHALGRYIQIIALFSMSLARAR